MILAEIEKLFLTEKDSIRDAMKIITEAPRNMLPTGICLIVDAEKRLIGTVTDGDIRKALVKGMHLDDELGQIMARNPITVGEGLSNDEMVQLVKKKVIDSGRIRDTKVDKVVIVNSLDQVVDVIEFFELFYKQEFKYKNICVVGTGHIGLVLQVVLADSGYNVIGYDIDGTLVKTLKQGRVPFYEKGLEPLVRLHLKNENVQFTQVLSNDISDCYIVCVGTPVDQDTKVPDESALREAVIAIGKVLKKDDIVIMRSTVPVGTTRDMVIPILEKKSKLKAGRDFYIAFTPERVVEGRALEETKEIPQIIGGYTKTCAQIATKIFKEIVPSIIILDSLEEAEMVKLINNSFRDLSFSFANNVALMCDSLGIGSVKVIKAANEGYPRNPVPLPSPGVGGYCLTKDPYLMAKVAKKANISDALFHEGRRINDSMPQFVVKKVKQFLNEHCKNKAKPKIYILGIAFKGNPETSDVRGSISLQVVDLLRKDMEGRAHLCAYDPLVSEGRIQSLNLQRQSYEEGFRGADCILVLNNNKEFAQLDIYALLEKMNKPGLFFDGWYLFLPEEIARVQGIIYKGFLTTRI